jgi:hemolysin activation/secretion protein
VLHLGLGLASTEPKFTVFKLSFNFHQQWPGLYETDLTGQTQLASRRTPLFEQPSLGGAEVLRGFRRDDAIGRRLWSLQHELWMPLPFTRDLVEGPGQFLRRNVRLAGFVDVGGVSETTASQPGTRVGPGLGVRIRYFPAVLKFDWAYGIGDGAQGKGHGRFYFSLSTTLPF